MRRILIAVLCCLMLVTAVSAASSVTDLQSNTTVTENGTCEVTVTLQLKLEEVPAKLLFPLPSDARNITVNGGPARTSLSGSVRNVNLSSSIHSAGVYTVTLHYDLPDAVTLNKSEQLILTLQLLSGFAYPIEKMQFSITLPGVPEHRPQFVSTYLQESADSYIDCTVDGSVIHGSFKTSLKDHESLTMTLVVPEDQFPQPISKRWSLSADDIVMYSCMAGTFLYWILTMRALPPRKKRRTQEPEGLTAGHLGCALTRQGVDFTALVISWAQKGYLLIQLDENDRVLLHRRMEMGNERSEFEVRAFRTLFGKRRTVDGTGSHFSRLSRKVSAITPNIRSFYLPGSGNPRILRLLCAAVAVMGGVSLALAIANDTIWQILLAVVLIVAGALLSFWILNGAAAVHLRRKQSLFFALTASFLWLLLGVWSAEWGNALLMLLFLWFMGFAQAYGGRRSDTGKQAMSEILGLRRHLSTVSKEELQQILRSNPEYYYALAPHALELGVDKAFARQMAGRKLPQCSYLVTTEDGHITAKEWNQLLRTAASAMDASNQRSMLEKLLGK
ncbi:MAG: DUF2207 domain-containing protein [Oscillospiraceae bacterium]|nr:DUF2207 domain-containing protein [Oscillospiraceae bacterium]